MKKVGILTFQNANNFGAVLQAFALQETLKKLNADVKVINYDSPKMQLGKVQEKRFLDFIQNNLNLTEAGSNINDINTSIFDIFITGSDQVWNPALTNHDYTYFLDFVNSNAIKASYAASIGLNENLLNQYNHIFKEYIPKYDGISLREASHVDIVKNLLNNNSNIISSVDPSILLKSDEYIDKLKLETPEENDYILMFSYFISPRLVDFVNMLSIYTGYKIVAISIINDVYFNPTTKVIEAPSPKQWLEYMKNAKLILTDSFHGLMYSLVFEKPFYAFTPLSINVLRLLDSLKMFGFEHRRLTNINDVRDIDFDLDYTYARTIIEQERQRSNNYLNYILNL